MFKLKKETYFAIVIILAMLSWGGSWTSGKSISSSIELVVFWRFFITFISFIPIILFLKQSLHLNRVGFFQIVAGAIFLVIYNFFFLNGEKSTFGLAGSGGVLVTTLNPLFTFIISLLIFKQPIKKKETYGLLLGLLGGAILLKAWNVFNPDFMNIADTLFLLAAFTWAMLSVVSQKSKENMTAFVFSFYTYGLAALISFFIAIPKDVFNISQINGVTWFNIFYLSLAATTFGTTAYFFAASKLGASKASSYTFLVPASAVFFSWLILHEQIKIYTVIGGILALAAVYMINYRKKIKS